MTNKPPELLNCPFCGSNAYVDEFDYDWFAGCQNELFYFEL